MKTGKQYSKNTNLGAITRVGEQGYREAEAARAVDVNENNLRRWKKNLEQERRGERLSTEQREELIRFRRESRALPMGEEGNEAKYGFIRS